MAPSYFAATRQLDDGSVSTYQARRGYFDSNVEAIGRGGILVEDCRYDGVRHSERQERGLVMHGDSLDLYSYRHTSSNSSSDYPIPTNTRTRGQYKNDSFRRMEESQEYGGVQNDVPEWEKNNDCRANFTLSTVQENCNRYGQGKDSYMCKPGTSYGLNHGSEYGFNDLSFQNSNRRDIQPGFQRVLYDARVDSKPKNPPPMIEISPGEYLRLRGADETWRAIHDDFYVPCACVCCELTLFCIQDAVFVLCPECMIVSPLEGVAYDGHDGGVGMGFTMESLARWQEEIQMQTNRGDGRVI